MDRARKVLLTLAFSFLVMLSRVEVENENEIVSSITQTLREIENKKRKIYR